MARIDVGALSIGYELIGSGKQAIAITPGGRFSKDTPGVRGLAEAVAAGGYTALIWDRPNCGESDISFDGACESFQNADALAGLIRALGIGPAITVGASGGARETLLNAIRHPDDVAAVFVLWLSGGAIGIATLPITYCAGEAIAAATGGMEAVAALPGWAEPLRRNPANRARLLGMDPARFVTTMRDWSEYFMPQPGVPIPCVSVEDLAGIRVPTTVLRSGISDFHHTRETSEKVAAMIPGARLNDPPWGDTEWLTQLDKALKLGIGPFSGLPALAPAILAFADDLGAKR